MPFRLRFHVRVRDHRARNLSDFSAKEYSIPFLVRILLRDSFTLTGSNRLGWNFYICVIDRFRNFPPFERLNLQ